MGVESRSTITCLSQRNSAFGRPCSRGSHHLLQRLYNGVNKSSEPTGIASRQERKSDGFGHPGPRAQNVSFYPQTVDIMYQKS